MALVATIFALPVASAWLVTAPLSGRAVGHASACRSATLRMDDTVEPGFAAVEPQVQAHSWRSCVRHGPALGRRPVEGGGYGTARSEDGWETWDHGSGIERQDSQQRCCSPPAPFAHPPETHSPHTTPARAHSHPTRAQVNLQPVAPGMSPCTIKVIGVGGGLC